MSRYSCGPSQSGEHLEVPSPFQKGLCNTKAVCILSSLDLSSFPFQTEKLSAYLPIPLSSSSLLSSPGLFLSIPSVGGGEKVLYSSFTLLLALQSFESPSATSLLPTSCPLNSFPPTALSVLAFFLSHFHFFFSSQLSSSIIPTLRRWED